MQRGAHAPRVPSDAPSRQTRELHPTSISPGKYESHNLTGFVKTQTRAARMELRHIAVTEIAQEI